MNSKVAGVTFENRQEVVALLTEGEVLTAVREPDNAFDSRAIALRRADGTQVGYINSKLAWNLSTVMDVGIPLHVVVTEVTGRMEGRSLGANIRIEQLDLE